MVKTKEDILQKAAQKKCLDQRLGQVCHVSSSELAARPCCRIRSSNRVVLLRPSQAELGTSELVTALNVGKYGIIYSVFDIPPSLAQLSRRQ